MDIVLLEQLLKTIYKFYPVGIPAMQKRYSGWSDMRKITSDKINAIIENSETPWRRLINDFKELYPEEVLDFNYFQSPSYDCTIHIEGNKAESFQQERKLIISISLLGPYYTLFFEDNYVFTFQSEKERNPRFKILFLNALCPGRILSNAEVLMIKSKIESYFSNYTFVPHRMLYTYNLDYADIDDGNGMAKPTPLSYFLFSSLNYGNENISVLD